MDFVVECACICLLRSTSPTSGQFLFLSLHARPFLSQFSGINAKLIVCGMASNGFSIADPGDSGMLDMVGFDSAAPEVIRNFVLDLF